MSVPCLKSECFLIICYSALRWDVTPWNFSVYQLASSFSFLFLTLYVVLLTAIQIFLGSTCNCSVVLILKYFLQSLLTTSSKDWSKFISYKQNWSEVWVLAEEKAKCAETFTYSIYSILFLFRNSIDLWCLFLKQMPTPNIWSLPGQRIASH